MDDVQTDAGTGVVLTAADVMSSPVVTVRADTPIAPAAALLASHGFTAAPVLGRDGNVVGMVTEGDLVRGRFSSDAAEATTAVLVDDVMTPPPAALCPDDDLADVAAAMVASDVRSVPIMDGAELVGVVTWRDLLRVVARHERTPEQVRRRRGLRA